MADVTSGCSAGSNGAALVGTVRATSDCVAHGTVAGSVTIIAQLPAIQSPGVLVQGTPVTLTLVGRAGALFVVLFDYRLAHLPVPGFDVPLLLSPSYFTDSVRQIGAGGVEKIVEIELDGADKAGLQVSVDAVKELLDACKALDSSLA